MVDFFNYDSVKDTYDILLKQPVEQRQHFTTVFVLWSIAHIVYYIVAGLIIWTLGRRLIQASFAAFREARRERP